MFDDDAAIELLSTNVFKTVNLKKGLYKGEVNGLNRPQGRGEILYADNSSIAEGYWQDGKRHGKSRQIF